MKIKRFKIPVILTAFVVTIAIAAASATVALGFFVADSDTIFPNVSAEGINLSGMTIAEANHRLVSGGFERNADAVSVTVNFPDGSGFSISGYEAGFARNAEDAALAAFLHGRDGSFFGNTFSYVRSLRVGTSLNGTSVPVLDEDFVRGTVSLHTRKFNESLIEASSYSFDEYSIIITAGVGFAPANEDSVFYLVAEALYAALREGSRLVVNYTPAVSVLGAFDLNALYNTTRTEPVSAVFNAETLEASESFAGISFDLEAAIAKYATARMGEHIVIPLIFTDPEVTAEYLQGRLFRDELASRTTHVAGTAARLNNVRLAASYIHDVVLGPGDVFSFNETVGRRTAARGFMDAGGFRDGRLVDMIGGGICQVSSTLYDNVLHAYLEVVARRAHTLPIAYLPLGHDAAIYWGVLDLRFRNNTPYPIRIEIELDGRSMTSRFIGTRTNDYVIRIDSYSTAVPFETIERVDESVPYGETIVYFRGANGAIAYTYRVISDAYGNRISRTRIARDVYRAQSRIVLIPPADAQPDYNPT
ncbi:MAG: VanW family protein [Defluviitaleaceae bacterium]|nr:VanW family protein [Defluviitaleaceae bacterium]